MVKQKQMFVILIRIASSKLMALYAVLAGTAVDSFQAARVEGGNPWSHTGCCPGHCNRRLSSGTCLLRRDCYMHNIGRIGRNPMLRVQCKMSFNTSSFWLLFCQGILLQQSMTRAYPAECVRPPPYICHQQISDRGQVSCLGVDHTQQQIVISAQTSLLAMKIKVITICKQSQCQVMH